MASSPQLLTRSNSNLGGNSNLTPAMNQQLVSAATATGNHNINHGAMNRSGSATRNSNQHAANGSTTTIRSNQMGGLNSGNGSGTGSVRNANGNDTNNLNLTSMDAHQQHHNNGILVASGGPNQNSTIDNRSNQHPQHNVANQRTTANIIANNRMVNAPIVTSAPPLVLSLSQVIITK